MGSYILFNILQFIAVLLLYIPWSARPVPWSGARAVPCYGNAQVSSVKAEKNSWLYWAELLADHIDESNTNYRHKQEIVTWKENGEVPYQSYADCSGLINALIKQSGHEKKILKDWFGTCRPLAVDYYNAISTQNKFSIVSNIRNLLPGDLIVIKYADRSTHEDNTGHCLLVDQLPSPCKTYPEIPGLRQYAVWVIDSSKSPHGKQDSRYKKNGEPYQGLGRGLFRLYADAGGEITGYSWSLLKPHKGFDPLVNPIIAGRPIP
jgi:hypothetical protein